MKIQINKQALDIIDKVDVINKKMNKKWGVGILEEHMPKVMEKFERQHKRLFDAIDSKDNAVIYKEATQTIKAWSYIDKKAEQIFAAAPPLLWKVKHSSGHILHVHNSQDPIKHEGIVFSLQELVKFVPAKVLELKLEIRATVTQVKEIE